MDEFEPDDAEREEVLTTIRFLYGSRVIRSGAISLDRDLNGARNIFIRSLGDSPTLMLMRGAC
jgi:hypothetical protein